MLAHYFDDNFQSQNCLTYALQCFTSVFSDVSEHFYTLVQDLSVPVP